MTANTEVSRSTQRSFTVRLPFFGSKKPTGPIRLPLPDALTVFYLVYFRSQQLEPPAAEQLLPVVTAWVERHTQDPLRSPLLEICKRGLLQLKVGPRSMMPEPPRELLNAWRPGELDERRFLEATHMVVIITHDLPRPPRLGLWLALAAARALAEASGGVVLDPDFPRLLPQEDNGEDLPASGRIHIGSHILVPQSIGNKGLLWTTTKGLSKFGLPELEVRDAPPNLNTPIGYLVTGAAQRLARQVLELAMNSEAEPKEILLQPVLRISLEDVVAARTDELPEPPEEGARGWVEVGLEYHPGRPDDDSFLRLTPPPGTREKPGVWWSTAVTEVFGSGESTLRNVKSDSEAMEAAHMQAVSELPRAKQRFAAGLQPGEMLIVKHGFPTGGDQHEFMWLSVNTWRGDRLTCQLMNSPEIRRDLRTGQIVELLEAELFDWAIMRPDGEIEGGYTNRVVMQESGD